MVDQAKLEAFIQNATQMIADPFQNGCIGFTESPTASISVALDPPPATPGELLFILGDWVIFGNVRNITGGCYLLALPTVSVDGNTGIATVTTGYTAVTMSDLEV